jgi:hypothetical protein
VSDRVCGLLSLCPVLCLSSYLFILCLYRC